MNNSNGGADDKPVKKAYSSPELSYISYVDGTGKLLPLTEENDYAASGKDGS